MCIVYLASLCCFNVEKYLLSLLKICSIILFLEASIKLELFQARKFKLRFCYLDHDQNGNRGFLINNNNDFDRNSQWHDQFGNQTQNRYDQVDQDDHFQSDQIEVSDHWNDHVDCRDQADHFQSNFETIDPWNDHVGSGDQNDRYDQVPEEEFSDFEEEVPEPGFSEKRYNVINELISTEKDYLESLEIVRDHFILPLKQNGVLAEDEMEIIFINWNDLWLCTNRLYKSLKIRRKMTIKQDINIGDILCENVSLSFFSFFFSFYFSFSVFADERVHPILFIPIDRGSPAPKTSGNQTWF